MAGKGTMAVFTTRIKVRFQHTDPAGILFYPRYFEMLNQVMEDWFEEALGCSHRTLVLENGMGIPAVNVEGDFVSPSELGDIIDFTLWVVSMGRTSCTVMVAGVVAGIPRLRLRLTVVYCHRDTRKPAPWPADLRRKMLEFQDNDLLNEGTQPS